MSWYGQRAEKAKQELDALYVRTKKLSWVALIAVILGIGSCKATHDLKSPYVAKENVTATLELAYEYQDKCSKHNTCSAWMGRFKEDATGRMWDREIGGFEYQIFVDGGRAPQPGWTISVSQEDRGNETPVWIDVLDFCAFLLFFAGFSTILCMWIEWWMSKDMYVTLYGEYEK